jgi:hypothetical protein
VTEKNAELVEKVKRLAEENGRDLVDEVVHALQRHVNPGAAAADPAVGEVGHFRTHRRVRRQPDDELLRPLPGEVPLQHGPREQ